MIHDSSTTFIRQVDNPNWWANSNHSHQGTFSCCPCQSPLKEDSTLLSLEPLSEGFRFIGALHQLVMDHPTPPWKGWQNTSVDSLKEMLGLYNAWSCILDLQSNLFLPMHLLTLKHVLLGWSTIAIASRWAIRVSPWLLALYQDPWGFGMGHEIWLDRSYSLAMNGI